MTISRPGHDSARIGELLGAGHEAAKQGLWMAAGRSWIEAAKLGSAEGAHAASRVAAPHIRSLAEDGDADAQALTAGILMDYYTEEALPMAVGYAKASAAAGNAVGLRTYGFMLLRGLGVDQDRPRALELFRAAAHGGDAYGALNAAALLVETRRHGEYLRFLTQAAEGGLAQAAAKLGDELAADGHHAEALGWYVRAAEQGHDGAADIAADWYKDGTGTEVDLVQSMRWLFALTARLNGGAVHRAHQLGAEMTDETIREAGHLAGRSTEAENLIASLAKARRGE